MHFSWQQRKPPNANLGSTPQLSSPMGSPSSLLPSTCMLLLLIPLSFDDACAWLLSLHARHICLLLGSALTPSQYPETTCFFASASQPRCHDVAANLPFTYCLPYLSSSSSALGGFRFVTLKRWPGEAVRYASSQPSFTSWALNKAVPSKE